MRQPSPSPSSLPTPASSSSSSYQQSPSSLPTEANVLNYHSAWATNVLQDAATVRQQSLDETEEIFGWYERSKKRMQFCDEQGTELLKIETKAKSRSRTPRPRKPKLPAPADKLHLWQDSMWPSSACGQAPPLAPGMKDRSSKVPPDSRISMPFPDLLWPSEQENQWASPHDPPQGVFCSELSSEPSSPSFPRWEEEVVEEENNVSVAMPNMVDVPPVINDLPVQTNLAFNWIIRLAPWDIFTREQSEQMQPFPLLPPQREEHRFRKTLVLDLDETLVHCNVKLNEPGAMKPEILVHIKMSPKNTIPASVYLRPHCQELLQKAAGLFEVIVFTASVEPYATAVVDLLDKDRIWVTHVLCRDSCTELNGQLLKDMRRLGRNLEDVVLIDNSPLACGISPENSIVCKAYYGNDPHDTELLRLRSLLHKLQKVRSLPEYLDHRHGFTRFVKQQRQELIASGQAA